MKDWIVVACRAEAKIFERKNKAKSLKWIKTLENKKGRRKEREFDSDKPGFGYVRFGSSGSPHALESKHSHAEAVAEKFAHRIGKFLTMAYQSGGFNNAYVFASPDFLGLIKHNLKNFHDLESFTFINKNLEKATTKEIMSNVV